VDAVYGVFSSGLENLDEMLMEEFDVDSCGECGEGECGGGCGCGCGEK